MSLFFTTPFLHTLAALILRPLGFTLLTHFLRHHFIAQRILPCWKSVGMLDLSQLSKLLSPSRRSSGLNSNICYSSDHSRPDLRRLALLGTYTRNWHSWGRSCVSQIRSWRRAVKEELSPDAGAGERKKRERTAEGGGFKYSRLKGLPLQKSWQGLSSSISFVLMTIDSEVLSRELSSRTDLSGAQASRIQESPEGCCGHRRWELRASFSELLSHSVSHLVRWLTLMTHTYLEIHLDLYGAGNGVPESGIQHLYFLFENTGRPGLLLILLCTIIYVGQCCQKRKS